MLKLVYKSNKSSSNDCIFIFICYLLLMEIQIGWEFELTGGGHERWLANPQNDVMEN